MSKGLRLLTCALCLLLMMQSVFVKTAPAKTADIFELGIELLDQGKWEEALPIYQQLTKSHPFYAWGWLGLGWSLHYTGHYAEAILAYQQAIKLGAERPYRMMLEMARCYAALAKKTDALFWLEQAMQHGLTNVDRLRNDESLKSLKNEPRFRELVALVDTSKMTRNEGWRYDLKLLASEIRRVHFNPYRFLSAAELDRSIKEIRDAIPSLTDDEITVRLMELVRRLGDGHSYVVPKYQEDETQAGLPLLFSFFEEGLYVSAAAPEHEDLLWARVLKFDDATTERVYSSLDRIVSQDNSMRLLSQAPAFMRLPPILKALGLTRDAAKISLTIVDRQGRERIVTLTMTKGLIKDWVRKPADAKNELPLYAQNRKDFYWFKYFPETKLLYFQYNAVGEKKDESTEQFAARLLSFIEQNQVDKLVVDLRWNGGGNMFLSKPLIEGLLAAKKVREPGRLFVIAGRHTFSAAMIFAEQLERYAHAIFVGEPTGSSPNFVGETNFRQLPYSKM
ncbi:MAG: tetratricopeptide repeat protein [Acidobacteria bacterium]|nr:tetratricopeptide repeat protein [Acidobacteriota bacterium]